MWINGVIKSIMKLGWTIQIIPVGDEREHKTNFPEDCDCNIRVDDKTGVINHNAFDKRI